MVRRIAAVLLVIGLVAAGCGDSAETTTTTGPDTPPTSGVTTTTQAPETTTTVAETTTTVPPTTTTIVTTTTTTTTTTTMPPSGDVSIDQLRLLGSQARFRATYRVDIDGEIQTLTISQDPTLDPPGSALFTEEDGGQLIFNDEQIIFCSDEECFAVPNTGGTAFMTMFGLGTLGFFVDNNPPEGFDVDSSPDTIDGIDVVCFTVTPDDVEEFGLLFYRQCVQASTGVSVLIEIQEPGEEPMVFLELVELGEPLETDFIPPFPVLTP